MVSGGVGVVHSDSREGGGFFQVFLAVHLRRPLVLLSRSNGFGTGYFHSDSIFYRLVQLRSPTVGGDGTASLIL